MFGFIAGLSIRAINQCNDRNPDLGREPHQAQRFSIAFRVSLAVMRSCFFFGSAAAIVPNDDNSLAVQLRKTTNDCRIVSAPSISMEFQESRGHSRDVVAGRTASDVSRQTHLLPRSEER